MVALETEVAEHNGQLNGYRFEPLEVQKASDNAPNTEQTGAQQPASKSHPAECVAQVPTADQSKPDTTRELTLPRKKRPSSARSASTDTAEAQSSRSRVKYVPEAALRAEQEKLEELSRAALSGDTTALDELRAELDRIPHIWQRLGDLQLLIEQRLMGLIASNDPLRVEAFRKRASQLRHDLLDGEPGSLVMETAASRVVATFMFAQYLELRALQSPDELRCIKQLEQAERCHQVAMRTFLMAKRAELQSSQLA